MTSVIINSVDRALDILNYLYEQGKEVSITQISKDLDIYKSTVYRTLATLESKDFVEKNPETEKYGLGMKLLSSATASVRKLVCRRSSNPMHSVSMMSSMKQSMYLYWNAVMAVLIIA